MTPFRHQARRAILSLVTGAVSLSMLACSLLGNVPGVTAPTGTVPAIGSAPGTARDIQNGESATGRLTAQSTEIYSVKVAAGEALRLDIDVDGKPEDLIVGITDSTGKAIATQSTSAGKRVTIVTGPLDAGDYTITLTNAGSSETPYTLAVTTGDPAIIEGLAPGSDPTPAGSEAGSATPVAGGDGTGPGTGQTACDHPYFPMRTGASWTYDFVSSEFSGSYTMVIDSVTGDTESAQATMTMTFAEMVITYNWTCTRASGLQSLDYAMGSFGGGMTASNVTGDGSFLLPADQLVTNATWTYNSSGEVVVEAGGTSMSGSNTSSTTNTVAGVGGTMDYQGAPLDDILTVLAEQVSTISMGGIETPAINTTSTLQFARGIGLISSATVGDGENSSSTLTSYSIP